MKKIYSSIFILIVTISGGRVLASDTDHSFCISFEPDLIGYMSNSCSRDLDVTWCHSDSLSSCTDRWKAGYVPANGRATSDFDEEDEGRLFTLIYACDKGDSDCLKARNEFKDSKGR